MRGFGLVAVLAVSAAVVSLACGTSHVDGGATGGAAGSAGASSGSGAANGSGAAAGTNPSGNDGGSNAQGGTSPSGGNAGTSPQCDAGTECPGALCGNNMLDPGETCDEGDRIPFDGCSDTCQVEPNCLDGCPMSCGDGFVVDGEDCDDGNVEPNDGCSSDCVVEQGYTCTAQICEQTPNGCALRLAAVFRDFRAAGAGVGHSDFQPLLNSLDVIPDLVETTLDLDGKPVQSATASAANGFMHGQPAFAQWYRDTPGVNATIPGEIMLYDNGGGGYVNRWGASGERWEGEPVYSNLLYCGEGGSGCAMCLPLPAGNQCWDPCIPWGGTSECAGTLTQGSFDGNPMFFPIDPPTPGILDDPRITAKIAPAYGWNWSTEAQAATGLGITSPIATATGSFPSTARNFHFTSEVRILFRYESARTLVLDFTGDDDVWVFVNGRLALDLGGWHPPLDGSVTIDSTTAAGWGLADGGVYSLAMFHAERQTDGSSFRLSLTGLELERSVCVPN